MDTSIQLLKRATLLHVLVILGNLPNIAVNECTQTTCLNGGSCDKAYKGGGFKCNCSRTELVTDFGPRCEILTRSFTGTSNDESATYSTATFSLSGHSFDEDKFVVTLDLSLHCPSSVGDCRFLLIKGHNGSELLEVRLKKNYKIEVGSLLSTSTSAANNVVNVSSEPHWANFWKSITITMLTSCPKTVTTSIQLCSLRFKICVSNSNTQLFDGELRGLFRNSNITIGNAVGCMRLLRINGQIVDLGDSNIIDFAGSRNTTYYFCEQHQASCLEILLVSNASNKMATVGKNNCGIDSVCDGEISPSGTVGPTQRLDCNCRCTNDKRRELETVSSSEKCTNYASLSNECTIDTPIISTSSTRYQMNWTTQDGSPIAADIAFFSIEASIKTREMNVEKMLLLINGKSILPHIKISIGLLECCIDRTCHAFPKVSVADGAWHSLSASIRKLELTLMLDMVTKTHRLETGFDSPGAILALSIPNSCIRSIRFSNIYMPTSRTDVTFDSDKLSIKLHRDPESVYGPTCIDTWAPDSSCTCGPYEDCDMSTGQQKCHCKPGFANASDGKCDVMRALLNNLESSDSNRMAVGRADVVIAALIGSLMPALRFV